MKETILIFGTFDGIHDGHRNMFAQAKKESTHLIAAVAPDSIVELLKGRRPNKSVSERIKTLQEEDSIDEVVLGDQALGSYEILKAVQPTIVGIGYDQMEFEQDLRSWAHENMQKLKIIRFQPHEPETYKSSLM